MESRIGKNGYIVDDSDKRERSSILDRDGHT